MFVLHPSSRCDVCLEGFSWEAEMAPYAIPCGHVFCKRCLESVVPPKCPMCRKNFDPARLKKLHVDRPDGEEDPREGDLLQRVAMSFEVSEEHRRELLDEIDKWLEEKHEDAAQPLRKARVAIEKYHKLREMGIEDKREITVLKEEKREKALAAEAEKERTAAIETSLLERTKELQAQIVAAQGEIDHLRNEMQRRTQLKNPLPHPPQPTNFNIYSNFDSSTGPNAWYNDDGRSMLLPSRASVSIPNGVSYVHPRNLYPEDDRENRTHVLHESNGVKRDRKGKGRDIPEPAYDNRRSVYGPPHTALEAPKPKPGIIPGASPKSKFMPPDPETEVRERGFNAFKPPDPVPPYMNGRADLPHKGYDPARDSVDTYSLTASMLTELQNGLNEGFNRGFQAIQRAIPSGMPSGSRARDSDPEAGAYASDIEREERRARRRREREKEKQRDREREREREREPDRPRREHRSRREREREGPQASSSRRSDPAVSPEESASLTSAVKGSSRGEDSQDHRTRHRQRASADVDSHTHEPNVPMPDNPSRQRTFSESRPRTGGPIPPHPVIPTPVAPVPPPSQPGVPQQPNAAIQPLAQPTPRVPLQPHLEELDHSAEVMQTPSSRHSTSTTDSWGTVASLSQASENSFNSLNLRTLPRQPTIPLNAQPYRSPSRPTPLQDLPQAESTDEETETEQVTAPARNPEVDDSGRGNRTSRTRRRNHERSHTAGGSIEQHRPSYPLSAPATAPGHGTRHTQTLAIPDHYQNPTLPYQHRPPSIQSASTANTITPEAVARSSRSGRSRRDSQHRSRHSSSQAPTSAVIPGTHYSSSNSSNPTNVRTRRVSFNAVHSINPSVMAPHSANDTYENDLGYHTDVPYQGNALGLAGLAESPPPVDHLGAQRGSAGLPISAPRPVTPNASFLRSFSYENYS